jgi:salicylate---[aryl-carrier protein] ligase
LVRGPRFPIDGVVYRSPEEQAALLASGAWLDTSVGDLIRATARAHPDKIYLHAGGREVTFAELDRRSEGLAASLIGQGLRPGDRAIFQMGIAAETVIALFGCYKAGVIPVCTLPQYRDIEIGQLADMSAAKAYFIQADFSPTFDLVAFARRMGLAHPTLKKFIVARGAAPADMLAFDDLCDSPDPAAAREVVAKVEIDPGDVLTFQLSGGSTGVPKIIPRMHGEYLAQARGWARMHQYGPNEICIWPLPIIHNAGLLLVVLGSLLNASAILLQEKFDPVAFLEAIEKYRVTWAGSIGPIAPRLLDYPDIARHDLSSLRMFVAMDRADAIEAHVGVVTMNLYGITEGLLMSTSPTDPPEARHWTNGRSSSGAFDEIRVLSFDGETPVPRGEQGELCFRGPHSLRAYYNADPEVNAASFTSDGFVRTSDIVREVLVDGVSHYVFLGRVKDNISRGNEKFAAEEVEKLIVQHPAVLDAKVVAMPDRYLGEKACAFIIPRPGETCPDVKGLGAFLVDQGLAKFKLPERIEAVTEFPVTRVGKVDKMAMRAIVKDKLNNDAGA